VRDNGLGVTPTHQCCAGRTLPTGQTLTDVTEMSRRRCSRALQFALVNNLLEVLAAHRVWKAIRPMYASATIGARVARQIHRDHVMAWASQER
jgi:hypothetical protein